MHVLTTFFHNFSGRGLSILSITTSTPFCTLCMFMCCNEWLKIIYMNRFHESIRVSVGNVTYATTFWTVIKMCYNFRKFRFTRKTTRAVNKTRPPAIFLCDINSNPIVMGTYVYGFIQHLLFIVFWRALQIIEVIKWRHYDVLGYISFVTLLTTWLYLESNAANKPPVWS